jgi:hypothetical protein
MRTERFARYLWHGVGSAAAWDSICAGEGLKLPVHHSHVHDIGDYGRAVYFTTSLVRAKIYSKRLNGHYPIVRAYVRLRNALILDWSTSGLVMHSSSPTFQDVERLRLAYGDPLHGTDASRAAAAVRWREGLLADGIDGIVAMHSNDMEVVVYRPEDAIRSYTCMLKRAKG